MQEGVRRRKESGHATGLEAEIWPEMWKTGVVVYPVHGPIHLANKCL